MSAASRRRPHPADRRRLQLVPTERAGREVWAALSPLVAGLDAVEEGLPGADRTAVRRYLDGVLATYRDYTG